MFSRLPVAILAEIFLFPIRGMSVPYHLPAFAIRAMKKRENQVFLQSVGTSSLWSIPAIPI
jgi:hypothetical protein